MTKQESSPESNVLANHSLTLRLQLKMDSLVQQYQLKEYLLAFFITDEFGQDTHSFMHARRRYQGQFIDELEEVIYLLSSLNQAKSLESVGVGQLRSLRNNSLERRFDEKNYYLYLCCGNKEDQEKLVNPILDELYEELLAGLEPVTQSRRNSLIAAAMRLLRP